MVSIKTVKKIHENFRPQKYLAIRCCFLIPTIVGRFCYYGPKGIDQADNVNSFSEYKETLALICEEGQPGVFTWTPPQDTPSEVYYQVIRRKLRHILVR